MRLFFLSILILSGFAAGCQSLNEDPKNTRIWYPSLSSPGYLNPAHEKGYADGTDPYPYANIGTASMQMRPHGYDLPRNWNAEVTGTSAAGKKN